MMYRNPGIDFDPQIWQPEKLFTVRHQLMDHPLLALPEIVALGKRLGAVGSVRYHDAAADIGTDFATAPETHKARLSVDETLESIEKAHAWMALHNIQQDEKYRKLVDEVLDYVRPLVDRKDPGMTSRAGWIFVSSPNAVTPFHMDHENNFILQIHGTKTLFAWEPLDRRVVPEQALELFHTKYSRKLLVHDDAVQARARTIELQPGLGGYLPQTAPHAVKNGPGISVTVSFTYLTEATRRRAMIHRANYKLRERGLAAAPVGAFPVRDSLKHAAYRTALWGARRLGRGPPAPKPYADASNQVPV